ncbi:MAG: 3-deoxy-7-phosphoheptulonate synthase, partial [Clostridia bacterium]|nr:3-deoxy-7-phosphoheptulonate synthase [Clostridia bacterium]
MNMVFRRKLPIPKDIKELYPLTDETAAIKSQRDVQIKDIFAGKSDKLLLVVGPCSADAEAPVLDYVGRLARLQEKVADKMVFVPRVYTNKPRTVGQGYMGMLHQPDPKGEPDLLKGIVAIRSLHMKVLSETGLSTADEMLYP